MSYASITAYAADTTKPSDVEGITATPLNGAIKVAWEEATDDTGIAGYQVHYGETPVTQSGQVFDEVVDVGNVLEYTVTGLKNGTDYYFSIIAYDAAKNESANWGLPKPEKVKATPSADLSGAVDEDAPQVSEAEALNKVEVKVVFNEGVVLPSEDPQDAFGIQNDDSLELLPVTEAKMDEEDKTNKTVILTTEEQVEGASYKLTVGIAVEDKYGNPINSGTSDTAMFDGSGAEKEVEDAAGPEVVKAESKDATHLMVEFNEAIVLSTDPATNFNIMEKESTSTTLQVLGVELVSNSSGVEDAAAVVTTAEQSDKEYVVVVSGVKDEAGNEIDTLKGSATFNGGGEASNGGDNNGGDNNGGDNNGGEEPDTIAPKDVVELMAKVVFEAGKYVVKLNWENPAENKDDSIEQVLYLTDEEDGDYDKKASVDPEADKYNLEGLETGEYWAKLTQKDEAGNESEGTIVKFVLSDTGPELLGLVLVSLGLGRVVGRKKKK